MFRWPVAFTPFSRGGAGQPRDAVLEVTPRGATFTLAALSHVGHPAHLALIDAYLKGQVRRTATTGIGEDSRIVAASLAAPLVAAYERGIERIGLGDLVRLPRDLAVPETTDRSGDGQPVRAPDSARFLLRTPDGWRPVHAAERFESPGCLGSRQVGSAQPWDEIVVGFPDDPRAPAGRSLDDGPGALQVEARDAPAAIGSPSAALVSALRALALARFADAPPLVARAAQRVAAETRVHEDTARGRALVPSASSRGVSGPVRLSDVLAERATTLRQPVLTLDVVTGPGDLVASLAEAIRERRPALTALPWRGLTLDVWLRPDPDGYQTLCLLPPADAAPATLFEPLRDAAWATIEASIGRPLAEYRAEPIALRLVGADRTTTLEVGASVVIVRNQTVFTGWVGSDGRVMLKLFPPGGMRAD